MQEFTLPKGDRRPVIEKIARYLAVLSTKKAYRLEVVEDRSERSTQQCRYLNGVVYKIIGDAMGYERDDISEFLCGEYWGWHDKRVPKSPKFPYGIERIPVRTTTTNEQGRRDVLPWDQFADYVAFVQRLAAANNIYVPDPDPSWREHQEERAA